jgi:hypothetical protein
VSENLQSPVVEVRGLCLTTCSSRKSSDREVRLPVAERRMRGMEAILSGERERGTSWTGCGSGGRQ